MIEQRNFWQKTAGGRVSRRAALRGAGLGIAGLAGAALIGCGDDDEATTTAATPTPASAATAAAAAATEAPGAMGPLRGNASVAQSANVYETIDAHLTVASPVLTILSAAQSKILRFSNPNTGELVGDLAESWETPDPLTVVLNLRPGVKWHSAGPGARHPASTAGRDLTAEDIVFNIVRQRDGLMADGSEGPFGRNSFWSKVTNAEIVDDRTVKLSLTKQDGTFIEGLANEFNLIAQPELITAVEPNNVEISADKVIGTGPYILTEWVPGERISAVRNEAYYDPDRPYMDGQRWIQSFEDPTAYRIAFEQKQVDSFTDPDPGTPTAIHEANKDSTYLTYQGVANTVAVYLNPNVEPWNDNRLVRAINMVIDRRQLIQQLHNGLGKVSGPVSWMQQAWALPQDELEKHPGYRIDRDVDLKEANALWSAAGGPALGDIDWVIAETWALRAAWTSTPEIIAAMFNDAFSTTQFRGVTKSYGEIIPSWFNKTFDPFFAWIPNIEIPDARADLIGAFNSGSKGNIWSVDEPVKIDAKLDAAAAELDKEVAYEILKEVQEFVMENGQFGRCICYNYIFPALRWNYMHPPLASKSEGWNFLANSLNSVDQWIDSNDPSFSGRRPPTLKAI
jgi:ABC-type transport system substrate-binding protein